VKVRDVIRQLEKNPCSQDAGDHRIYGAAEGRVTSAPEHGVAIDGYSRGTTIRIQPTLARAALP
jgi:hypothetical protein